MTKKPVGRPRIYLEPRVRRNLNIERSEEFDANLLKAQEIMSQIADGDVITQKEAVHIAMSFYVLNAKLAKDRGQQICPRCKGFGYIAIRNGDDDETCECCGQSINTGEIPF